MQKTTDMNVKVKWMTSYTLFLIDNCLKFYIVRTFVIRIWNLRCIGMKITWFLQNKQFLCIKKTKYRVAALKILKTYHECEVHLGATDFMFWKYFLLPYNKGQIWIKKYTMDVKNLRIHISQIAKKKDYFFGNIRIHISQIARKKRPRHRGGVISLWHSYLLTLCSGWVLPKKNSPSGDIL